MQALKIISQQYDNNHKNINDNEEHIGCATDLSRAKVGFIMPNSFNLN